MTDRYAQGTGEPHLGWSVDLRLERVTQDRLRTGTRNIDASQASGEEAIERRTENTNFAATLDYGLDSQWSVSLRIPVVRRDHRHDLIDEDTGLPSTPEHWRFTRVGDVQITARRQTLAADGVAAYALFGGLKLPTGSTSITNEDGTRAERALQPGTGTVDLLLGVAGRYAIGAADALIAQASVFSALNSRAQYRPGTRIEIAGGWSHAFSPVVGSVVQLNFRHRAHDRGAQAEPENSGSTTVDVSPGLTFAAGEGSTLYAYVQVPVYQDVRGIQLVPRRGFALGWTRDF